MSYHPDNSTLQMIRHKVQTDVNGLGIVTITVPGTPGATPTRFIRGGKGWFDTHHADDHVTKVYVKDTSGYYSPAGTILQNYHDTDVATANQGWYFEPDGIISVEAIAANPGKLLAGLDLIMEIQKGDNSQEYFRTNTVWGV